MFDIGLEREFFCVRDDEVVVVPKAFPADDCGWLVEARGKPFRSPREAVFSLLAEEDRLQGMAKVEGVTLVQEPVHKVSRSLRLAAQRQYAKGRIEYQNLYGYERHRNTMSEALASVQVTMRKSREIATSDKTSTRVSEMFDFPRVIGYLDDYFAEEIHEAKRRPGFYELKSTGMVEYRSLPNSISSDALIEALERARYLAG